jgi:hypothetical protein
MKKEAFIGLFWLLFGIYFAVESYKFGLGEWRKPGPGYFPFGAGVLFTIISVYVFVKTLRKAPSGGGLESVPSSERFHWQNIALIVIGMLAYALLLKRLGFALCTLGLAFFLLRAVAGKGWLFSTVTGLVVAVVFQIFFNMLLNAQLPNGILGFLG